MQEQFVTYEIALKLKELGFNEECLGIYVSSILKPITQKPISGVSYYNFKSVRNSVIPNDENCAAPLWQQVIDWLRERYNLYIWIQPINSFNEDEEELNSLVFLYCKRISDDLEDFENYEKAILKALELCKNN